AGPVAGLVREGFTQWILFLFVIVLMWWSDGAPPPPPSSGGNGEPEAQDPPGQDCRSRFTAVPNSSFRILYRFIVLGIRGFGNALCQKAFSGTEGVDQWY
ncbi:MAG: hypothetical protein LBE17_13300, partial [Treponema sp.]|nr:hypothetical protein [Treponema sp.]